MKTIISLVSILLVVIAPFVSTAQTALKTETIKVWGNCGSCKKHIEKAAKAAGATTALWNEGSKQLKVSYASSKSSSAKIQQSVAKAGYDTQDMQGSDAAYQKLDQCCQYDRKIATAPADKQ